jgi:ribosome biogenesis protein UTP30
LESILPSQMSFPLGNKTRDEAKRALKSLIAHEIKEGKSGQEKFIYLVINTENPLTKTRDHTPRIM